MKINKTVLTKVERVEDVICDVCGRSCKTKCGYEFALLKAEWGYESRKDTEYHECHICESCYDKLPLLDKVRVTHYI